jgi:hypothetical protein
MTKSHTPYAPASLDAARQQIETLFAGFRAATGIAPTRVTLLAGVDAKFSYVFREKDIMCGTVDRINSRLSALWPEDKPWPVGTPRMAPAEIDDVTRDQFARFLSLARARNEQGVS